MKILSPTAVRFSFGEDRNHPFMLDFIELGNRAEDAVELEQAKNNPPSVIIATRDFRYSVKCHVERELKKRFPGVSLRFINENACAFHFEQPEQLTHFLLTI